MVGSQGDAGEREFGTEVKARYEVQGYYILFFRVTSLVDLQAPGRGFRRQRRLSRMFRELLFVGDGEGGVSRQKICEIVECCFENFAIPSTE